MTNAAVPRSRSKGLPAELECCNTQAWQDGFHRWLRLQLLLRYSPCGLCQCLSLTEYLLRAILMTASLSCFRITSGLCPNKYVNMSCIWSASRKRPQDIAIISDSHDYFARLLLTLPKYWKQRFACSNGYEDTTCGPGGPWATCKVSIYVDENLRFKTMWYCSNRDIFSSSIEVWNYTQQLPIVPLTPLRHVRSKPPNNEC